MNLTVGLTGALPAIVIISAVLTALVSVLLLRLYRRRVVHAMNVLSEVPCEPAIQAQPSSTIEGRTAPVLTVIDSSDAPDAGSPGEAAYRRAMQSLRQAAIVCALGGLAYSLVMTASWMIAAGGEFFLVRFLTLSAYFAWPIALSMMLLLPSHRIRTAGVYFVIVAALAVIGLIRSPDLTIGQLLHLWLFTNGPATVLLLAFINRPVRAVGPLVLAFMLAAVTGSVVIVAAVGSTPGLMRGIAAAGGMLGLGAMAIFIVLHLIGFALFGVVGWGVLCIIGRRYQAKRMSDQSITLDALWLLFGLAQSFTLVFENWVWIFTGLVAFLTYKLVTWTGFGLLARTRSADAAGRTLLLLRVFSLGRQSERLFDILSNIWLRSGSINLIAGPDLATATVEPHEFLYFLGGRLSHRFVQGEKDLEQRLALMDTRADPDGRYRVNEFFCRADTWQMTMQRLTSRSDVVLMDLRSFTKTNQGCIYELRRLMNSIPLSRLILVIDGSTDRDFLETTMRELWLHLESTSPNTQLTEPAIRCFPVRHQTTAEIERLLLMLFA